MGLIQLAQIFNHGWESNEATGLQEFCQSTNSATGTLRRSSPRESELAKITDLFTTNCFYFMKARSKLRRQGKSYKVSGGNRDRPKAFTQQIHDA
jgi:hypothetical protein